MGHDFGIFAAGLNRDHLDRQCADVDANVGHGVSVLRKPGKGLRGLAKTANPIDSNLRARSRTPNGGKTTVRSEDRRTTALMMFSIGNYGSDPHHSHAPNGSRIDCLVQNQQVSAARQIPPC